MQTTLKPSLQHYVAPRLRADTEKPERQPVLQGPSKHVATALVHTTERRNRTHKTVSIKHIIGLSRTLYSAREQIIAINMLNEKEE